MHVSMHVFLSYRARQLAASNRTDGPQKNRIFSSLALRTVCPHQIQSKKQFWWNVTRDCLRMAAQGFCSESFSTLYCHMYVCVTSTHLYMLCQFVDTHKSINSDIFFRRKGAGGGGKLVIFNADKSNNSSHGSWPIKMYRVSTNLATDFEAVLFWEMTKKDIKFIRCKICSIFWQANGCCAPNSLVKMLFFCNFSQFAPCFALVLQIFASSWCKTG